MQIPGGCSCIRIKLTILLLEGYALPISFKQQKKYIDMANHSQKKHQNRLFGTRSHPAHRKAAVTRRFHPGTRSWYAFWRINKLFFSLGFGYSDSHKSLAGSDPAEGLPIGCRSGKRRANKVKRSRQDVERPVEETLIKTENTRMVRQLSGSGVNETARMREIIV